MDSESKPTEATGGSRAQEPADNPYKAKRIDSGGSTQPAVTPHSTRDQEATPTAPLPS